MTMTTHKRLLVSIDAIYVKFKTTTVPTATLKDELLECLIIEGSNGRQSSILNHLKRSPVFQAQCKDFGDDVGGWLHTQVREQIANVS